MEGEPIKLQKFWGHMHSVEDFFSDFFLIFLGLSVAGGKVVEDGETFASASESPNSPSTILLI